MKILSKMQTFSCNGEELSLDRVAERKVTSVTVKYLSASRKVSASGIMGFFGKKKIVQEEKEFVINDEQGINIFFTLGLNTVSIRFWDRKEWNKVIDYDEETLSKKYLMTTVAPYTINFHIGNLKSVNWS